MLYSCMLVYVTTHVVPTARPYGTVLSRVPHAVARDLMHQQGLPYAADMHVCAKTKEHTSEIC